MRLLLATTNQGKLRETCELLAGLSIELATLADLSAIPAPEETGATFAENARLKARYYATETGWTAVAEDSGLEIDAMAGAPGVHSARWGGEDRTYPEKFRLIYDALAKAPGAPRSARFVCAVAVVDGDRVLFETRESVEGEIAPAPRGEGGFGYDPIFYYPPFGCTLAEAGARKSTVSHRGQAFRALRAWISAAAFTTACATKDGMEFQPDTIVSMEKAALDRWGRGDPDGYLEIMAPEVTYFDPTLEARLSGKKAIEALVTTLRGKLSIERAEMIDPTVQREGDTAVLTFNLISRGARLGDGPKMDVRWNSTEVYRRISDEWKIVHSHWSYTKPEVGPRTP